jgi:hypothetical protein
MKKLAPALLLCLAACPEPPKTMQMEHTVMALADLHTWDSSVKVQDQEPYRRVAGWGAEILPTLVLHLTDETVTGLQLSGFDIKVKIGDVCFLILLQLTGRSWQEFQEDGVFVSTSFPEPVYCVRWNTPDARRRVQVHFWSLIPKE